MPLWASFGVSCTANDTASPIRSRRDVTIWLVYVILPVWRRRTAGSRSRSFRFAWPTVRRYIAHFSGWVLAWLWTRSRGVRRGLLEVRRIFRATAGRPRLKRMSSMKAGWSWRGCCSPISRPGMLTRLRDRPDRAEPPGGAATFPVMRLKRPAGPPQSVGHQSCVVHRASSRSSTAPSRNTVSSS